MLMTAAFWKGAIERAVKTWLQAFIATAGVQVGVVLTGDAFVALPWLTAFVTASVAALLSLATSIGNAQFTAGVPVEAPAVEVILPDGADVHRDGEAFVVAYKGHEEAAEKHLDQFGYDGVADDDPQRKA